MSGINRKRFAVVSLLAMLAGCKSQPATPLAQYPLTDAPQTLAAYRSHTRPQTVQSQATIDLTDARGQTVRLDAALLLKLPGNVRLRAWKFGTAVFDLTVVDEKAWVYIPRDEARPAMPAARKSITQWMKLLQGDVATNASTVVLHGDDLLIDTPCDGGTVQTTIDRRTLTVTQHTFIDSAGRTRFTLALSDYQPQPDGTLWPMAINATSDTGVVSIRCTDLSVNDVLPAAAFDPPARADVLP